MRTKFKPGDLAWLKPGAEYFDMPRGALVEILTTASSITWKPDDLAWKPENVAVKLVLAAGIYNDSGYWVTANQLRKIKLNAKR